MYIPDDPSCGDGSTVLDLSIALESIDENHEIMEHGSRIKINNMTAEGQFYYIFSLSFLLVLG